MRDRRIDGRTGMTKVTVAFQQFFERAQKHASFTENFSRRLEEPQTSVL